VFFVFWRKPRDWLVLAVLAVLVFSVELFVLTARLMERLNCATQ